MLHASPPVRASRILVLILSLLAVMTAAAEEIVSSPVIRIYDGGATDPHTRSNALVTAASIVAESGVDAAWRDCTPAGTAPPCDRVRGPRDLMIRILTSNAASDHHSTGAMRRDGAVHGSTLGFAVVESGSRTGVLGTIFMDRVRTTAERTGVDPAVLLGRAIAHEAGHLMLRTAGHVHTGLMRGVWTDEELVQDRRDDWLFAPAQRRLLIASTRTASTTVARTDTSSRHTALEIAPPAAEARDIGSTR